jgi:hypothetical protein
LSKPSLLIIDFLVTFKVSSRRGGSGAGFGAFLIFHATMSAFDAYDGNTIPEYTGLVVFSDPEEHSVLQLD